MIRCYRSTYEGCGSVPLFTSSIGDSELIVHFQEVYARFFPNCYYKKQGIQLNLLSYTPMNQGTICAKVYPEGIQPIRGNDCRLCLLSDPHLAFKFKVLSFNLFLHLSRSHSVSMRSVTYTEEI